LQDSRTKRESSIVSSNVREPRNPSYLSIRIFQISLFPAQSCRAKKKNSARTVSRGEKNQAIGSGRTRLDTSEGKPREPRGPANIANMRDNVAKKTDEAGKQVFSGRKRYPARYSGRIEKSPVDPLAKPLSRRDTCGGILDGLSPLG